MLAVKEKLTNFVDIWAWYVEAKSSFNVSRVEKWCMTPVNNSTFAGFQFASALVNNREADGQQGLRPEKNASNEAEPQVQQPDPTFALSESAPTEPGMGKRLDISI